MNVHVTGVTYRLRELHVVIAMPFMMQRISKYFVFEEGACRGSHENDVGFNDSRKVDEKRDCNLQGSESYLHPSRRLGPRVVGQWTGRKHQPR
jgi:hypothetical protein